MSISILFLAILGLAIAPFWTHQMFNDSYLRQLTQIAMDNAAIKLAQQDRVTLNLIETSNNLMTLLEKIHHPIHLAIASGMGSAQLLVQDKALEASIKEIHSNTFFIANWKWSESFLTAVGEMTRLGVILSNKKRLSRPPIFSKRCSLCYRENFWAIDSSQTNSWLKGIKNSWSPAIWIKLRSYSDITRTQWNYHLKDG